MDRRCAGALLALAACIASTAAAPTASNQTALDLYDGAQQGCYYNFQHYGEGDRIMTNEPCLNCTCHNRMLMCYLRVCPFTKPIGQDCSVEKRADQCCPIITCPDVPVDLLTSTSTTSPAEYGETGLGKLDRYGCSINGKYFPEGAKVPPTPSKPCEHCYCIRNMTTCVMQECTLHVDGCTPIYHKDVCCPVRYSCDHPEDEIPLLDDMTTTVRPTPGFLLTTTTLSPVTQMTQDCIHDDKIFADGALIKTEKACEHCYCMKGDIVCVVQECGTPMENEGKNCTSMPPREGQCCPDTYICEGDELTTETKPDFTTDSTFDEITTLSPPRRVVVEGSGYRKEPGEPFTEEPTFEPDNEGSGDDKPFKPIDEGEETIPETETTQPPTITTEGDDRIEEESPSTSRIPVVDTEMIDKVTSEPDKGENTVPSGGVNEDVPQISISDKTTPEENKLATEPGLTTESYFYTKTTTAHEDDSSITDTITTEAEVAPTKTATASQTTIADYQSPVLPDEETTAEPTEVTESTPNKQEADETPSEITTLEDKKDELTTKATDFVGADEQTTESIPPLVDQEVKTTTSQQLLEQENEVLVNVPTTESSTKLDITKTETDPAVTVATEVTTPGKEHVVETTSVNPVDNEIDEESYPTSSPGRIPGEGDCLLDGITYSNESIVPSSNNCHTSCRCISSIVKCDPIICSAPPDYMDNCQPMYDPPESCCPTYVCDHTRETVPPQSHSQMAGTDSPVPTPSVECDGDQCEISKDKEDSIEPTDSNKKPVDCGAEGCEETDKKPDHESHPSTEECAGEKCISPQAHCADGKCESTITPDQICDSENGCKIPDDQACQGEDCKTQSVSPAKDSSTPCDSADGCKDDQAVPSQAQCADGKCESSPTTNQICDIESGCQIPVKQACEGEDCKEQPELIPAKDSSAPCNNVDDCKEDQLPERVPDCEGDSCTSRSGPKETDDCKDGSDCAQPNQSPTPEECKEEGCRRKDVSDISKPATSECTDSNCVSQDNSLPITNAPESITEAVPKTTDLSESDETISDKPITDLPKTPVVEKEIEPKITTEASIFVKDEETTHYDVTDREKEAESMPSVTDIPEIETQAPEVQEYTTEVTMQKETTVDQLEVTPAPLEESSTNVPKPSDNETDRLSDLPGVVESESPIPETKPTEQPLVDEYQTEVTREDITSDQQKHEFTTEIPSIQDMATEISEDTTAYTHKDSPDITTKGPEYVQEPGEIQTESSTTVGSLDEMKEPDNVNEPPESDTKATEETSTEKLDERPIEHETQDGVTTPRSYGGETNAPEILETETPTRDVSEEQPDTHEVTPDKLSTLSPEQQAQTEIATEQPGSIATSDKPITSKPDDMVSVTEEMLAPDNESETKSPVLPEVSPSEGTPISVSTTIPEEELHTETPSHDTSDEIAVTPFETPDKNKVSTEAPMSIITDKTDEVEEKPTQASEISIPVSEEESTTLGTEVSPTESSGAEVEQKEPVKGETVKDSEKESSPGDEEHVEAMTEKSDTELKATVLPILDDEVSSEQPEIPVFVASTEKIPETVSIVEQPEDLEPSVTEAGVTESTASGQQTSEIEPVTSVPIENIDTKAPELFTEVPTHAVPEDNEIENDDLSTDIPELTIHEHTEPTFTTEKSEQFDAGYTGPPDMSATQPQDISTQKEAEKIPDLQENITNAPEVPATESQKEATEALAPELVTSGKEPSEYEIKDATTAVPDIPATELHEATGVPEVQDIVTEIPEMPTAEPEKVATESQEGVTEPALKVTEAPQTQDIATNIPETHKDDTGHPDSQTTIIPDVLEKEDHEESTEVPDSLDIVTNAPDVSESDSDREASESPSSQDTTAKVPELSETAVTEAQKEASEEPETQEVVTVVPETNMQKDVTKIPENQDIATSAPKISVTEAQEEASEAPQTEEASTKIPEILTTETQKDETEISDDLLTNIPEIPVTESQKETTEVTEASVGPDVVTEIPESPATKSEAEVTTVSVSQEGTTNVPETDSSETKKYITESPMAQDVATEISETSATESSQKEVTDASITQDTATSIPDIIATETQKEVTEASVTQDHETNIAETHVTDSPKEAIQTPTTLNVATDIPESPVTESQKDTTEAPVAQDRATKLPESLATEPQKEMTEAPMVQDIATNIPEIPATESHKEATETPVAQDVATNVPEMSATESQKEATEAPVTQDAATNIPDTSITESQKEVTETSVDQDGATNIPETPSTETKKDMTQAPVVEDIVTGSPEISATESQEKATEAPETQELATNTPEITATEAEEKVTEVPMAQDVANIIPESPATESEKEITEAPVAQDVATSVPETSAIDSEKEVTETPAAQDIATSVPETSALDSEKEVTETPAAQDIATSVPEISATESEKDITETPVAMDVATSGPEISATEPQKEATESPVIQDVATSVPKTSETESEKEVTETPVTQDVATSVTETSVIESEKEKTETPVTLDVATTVPEISATESQNEATETSVPEDAATSAPETFASESQKDVTESPVTQDVTTSIPEVSATESQQETTEAPVSQDVATSAPDTSVTELQKEVTETPVTKDIEVSVPETVVTESQKEVTEAPVTHDLITSVTETVSTESQREVTEAPVGQDVENEITETPVPHVIVTNIPEIVGTEAPKYDSSLSPEGELLHEQSTKVPESLVTETQDINIATDKPTTSLQVSVDNKPKDDEHTEVPLVEPSKPEKSDASTESPITSDSVEPDIKSPQPSDSDSDIVKATETPTTEYQPIEEEVDAFSKTPDQTESPDQTIKTSEEPEQTSEYPETTPYLVLLEEHTHKKDIYTTSPEEEITTGASDLPSDYEPTTQAYLDKVSESVLTTEAGLPPKQEVVPTEKDESAYVPEENVTKPSLISEEITTISPSRVTEDAQSTEKPQDLETNEISTSAPGEDQKETDKPSTGIQDETDKLVPSATEKPHETTAPEEEFILATTKATTIREEDLTSPSLVDKYGKPDEVPQPASEPETQKPDVTDELPKPGVSEVQTTEEAPQPDSDNQFPPSGTSGYGQEPDYGEEDQAFGPGTCRYGGKVYVSAQQIPRDDPCDFCFCFRSDIICLQQSCPPPIHGCHEEPIQGFCCPRYECPVSMATTLNVTTTTTTTTTTLPPHFLPHAYKGAAQRRGCQIKGHTYKVGEVVRASSGPCLHCTCGGDGQMKCDPKVCTPEPMLRQMIAAAVSAKRRR